MVEENDVTDWQKRFVRKRQDKKLKKKRTVLLIVGMLFVFLWIFMEHDYFFYEDSIAKITEVVTVEDKIATGPSGEQEQYYKQSITAVVKNGADKGTEITVTNSYAYSQLKSFKYRRGDQIFVQLNEAEDGSITGTIKGVKRDTVIVWMAAVILIGLILVAGRNGVASILSLGINITVFTFALEKYEQGSNILYLSIGMVILFSITGVLFINGFKKQTVVAVIGTITSVVLSFLIYYITLQFVDEPEYMMMDYIVSGENLEALFMAEVLIGGLGAAMDVAVSITSAVGELINQNREIQVDKLIASIKEVGYDVMGTMINVLFFSYLSGSIPMVLVKLKNAYEISSIIQFQIPFELIRFLTGAICIVLTIPVTGVLSIVILKKRGVRECFQYLRSFLHLS